jgi:hypothetical protein
MATSAPDEKSRTACPSPAGTDRALHTELAALRHHVPLVNTIDEGSPESSVLWFLEHTASNAEAWRAPRLTRLTTRTRAAVRHAALTSPVHIVCNGWRIDKRQLHRASARCHRAHGDKIAPTRDTCVGSSTRLRRTARQRCDKRSCPSTLQAIPLPNAARSRPSTCFVVHRRGRSRSVAVGRGRSDGLDVPTMSSRRPTVTRGNRRRRDRRGRLVDGTSATAATMSRCSGGGRARVTCAWHVLVQYTAAVITTASNRSAGDRVGARAHATSRPRHRLLMALSADGPHTSRRFAILRRVAGKGADVWWRQQAPSE